MSLRGRQVLALLPPSRLGEVQRVMRHLLDQGPANVLAVMTTTTTTTTSTAAGGGGTGSVRVLGADAQLLLPADEVEGGRHPERPAFGPHHLALRFHTTPHQPAPQGDARTLGIVVPNSWFWTGQAHTILLNDRLLSGREAEGIGFRFALPPTLGTRPFALHYPPRLVPCGTAFPITS